MTICIVNFIIRLLCPRRLRFADNIMATIPQDVILRSSAWLPQLFGVNAMTFGTTIVFARPQWVKMRTLRHELVHVKQWRELGWKFLPTYAWQSACKFVRCDLAHIALEREGYEEGDKYPYIVVGILGK